MRQRVLRVSAVVGQPAALLAACCSNVRPIKFGKHVDRYRINFPGERNR
jgi:hypothetical protein